MNIQMCPSTLAVCLTDSTVAHLMGLRTHDSETLDMVIIRLAKCKSVAPVDNIDEASVAKVRKQNSLPSATYPHRYQKYNYTMTFLGEDLRANTMAKLFGELIEALAWVAPEAVEDLAGMRAQKRAFVSRKRDAIHPGRPDLPTFKTRSGWWISTNVGRNDLVRALKAACVASSLSFGNEIRLQS